MPSLLRALVVVCALAWSATALAQTAAPPDVVMLHSGRMVRGTVMEVVPGESVVVLLADGQQTTFAASDVRYAGPAEGAPSAWIESDESTPDLADTPARDSSPDGMTRLQIEGTPGVEAGMESAEGTETRLCATPCEVHIPQASYRFGVVLDNRFILEREAHILDASAVLQLRFSNREGFRLAGGVVTVLMAIGSGILFFLGGLNFRDYGATSTSIGLFSGASIAFSLSVGLGLPLTALRDLFEVDLSP